MVKQLYIDIKNHSGDCSGVTMKWLFFGVKLLKIRWILSPYSQIKQYNCALENNSKFANCQMVAYLISKLPHSHWRPIIELLNNFAVTDNAMVFTLTHNPGYG